ncbi:MAG: D-hexose-6-phosphate mutarotase [Lentisphaerae bacterium]|nr:D-hexose-6-phosphate mutarotase [Lentisphaerota bacterium]
MSENIAMQLQSRFGSDNFNFFSGSGDLPAVRISNEFGVAEVMLHGAHVISYQPAGAVPVLWMSGKSMFTEKDPIRGGIPVCWPWFGPDPAGKFGGHGFARLSQWQVVETMHSPAGKSSVVLELTDQDVDAVFAPQPFKLQLTVTLGTALVAALKIFNTGDRELAYSGALHSYFNVADASAIAVEGLDDCSYRDSVLQCDDVQAGPVVIDREIDRIYRNTSGIVRIVDPVFNRVIKVAKSGSTSTVVWNPWIEKSKRMPDFGDEEYHTMVCVEAANAPAAGDSRVLPPGGMAELRQMISIE